LRPCTLHDSMLYSFYTPYPLGEGKKGSMQMGVDKQEVLKRLHYIDGHLNGIRKMIEEDKYCVDILRQTYAVRKAIEKLKAVMLENHLQTCVMEGRTSG